MIFGEDIYLEIINYLTLKDILQLSSIKEYKTNINRKKIHSKISANILIYFLDCYFGNDIPTRKNYNCIIKKAKTHGLNKIPIIKSYEAIFNFLTSITIIPVTLNERVSILNNMKTICNNILDIYNIHTYSFKIIKNRYDYHIFSKNTCKNIFISLDIWDQQPVLLYNQCICPVYGCRNTGLVKNQILSSRLLKALIN